MHPGLEIALTFACFAGPVALFAISLAIAGLAEEFASYNRHLIERDQRLQQYVQAGCIKPTKAD